MKVSLPRSIKAYRIIGLFVPMFLISCGAIIEETISNDGGYRPCFINTSVEAVGAATGAADDPLKAYQWYLEPAYANVTGAWDLSADGAGIEIGVVDDAVQLDHEDLDDNVESEASVNVFVGPDDENAKNPYPSDCAENGHGTSVSGIIAATAGNGRGIKGIAYNAKVWGANLILSGGFSPNQLGSALGNRVVQTDVLSNSWGYASPTFLSPASSNFDTLIENGLTTGSGGKGISYVFAAGNDGANRDSSVINADNTAYVPIPTSKDRSSYSEILNHRGAIVVCAVDSDHRVSSYSEFGPNLWLCGYSSSGRQPSSIDISAAHSHDALPLFGPGLPTLDLSGPAGYNDGGTTRFAPLDAGGACRLGGALFNFGAIWELLPACTTNAPTPPSSWPAGATSSYHRYFSGTSAATPMVSGVIALMRAAEADLTWRDVKLILAESARKPDGVSGFPEGANTYLNGTTKYSYNDAYGFGIVDAAAAVALTKKWTPVSQAMVKWMPSSVSVTPAIIVPATATTNINFIEYVQVEIQGGQGESNFGALDIKLTSPSSKESVFAVKHQCANRIDSSNTFEATDECPVFNNARTFTFGAANFLGETPGGVWTLVATRDGTPISNFNWKLIIHGHQR